jgi:hypothetical protein
MRGWGSSFVLSLVGAVLVSLGIAQLDAAFVRETALVEGRVGRVMPAANGYAVEVVGRTGRLELPTTSLPHPAPQALRDAAAVTIAYDTRPTRENTHAIVGLSVDGRAYFAPLTYAITVGLWALVVLVPGATMLGFGGSALLRNYRALRPVGDPVPAVVLSESALVIPFPGRRS